MVDSRDVFFEPFYQLWWMNRWWFDGLKFKAITRAIFVTHYCETKAILIEKNSCLLKNSFINQELKSHCPVLNQNFWTLNTAQTARTAMKNSRRETRVLCMFRKFYYHDSCFQAFPKLHLTSIFKTDIFCFDALDLAKDLHDFAQS